jgi:hypothetical protein
MNEDFELLKGGNVFEQFTRRAKKGCKHCYSRGYLLFDNPGTLQRYIQPCYCTFSKATRKIWHKNSTKFDSR